MKKRIHNDLKFYLAAYSVIMFFFTLIILVAFNFQVPAILDAVKDALTDGSFTFGLLLLAPGAILAAFGIILLLIGEQ